MEQSHVQPIAMPSDRETVLHDLSKTDRVAQQIVAGLNDVQLNWQPEQGRAWSIAQCLDHLAKTNTIYTAALRSAISNQKPDNPLAATGIRPGWFESYFIRSMDAPPRIKFKAGKKTVPSEKLDGSEVLRAFLSSHEEIRALIEDARGMDLNRVHFKSPFVSIFRFSVGAGLLIMSAHDRRHLWQAQQVRTAVEAHDFARAGSAPS